MSANKRRERGMDCNEFAGVGGHGDPQIRVDRANAEIGPTGKMGVAIDSAFIDSLAGSIPARQHQKLQHCIPGEGGVR